MLALPLARPVRAGDERALPRAPRLRHGRRRRSTSRRSSASSTASPSTSEALAGYEQDGNTEALGVIDGLVARARRRAARVSELELGRTLLLFAWAFGLAAIEIEIEGGVGWAERLPTWWRSRGLVGRVYGVAMGRQAADRLPRLRVPDPAPHPALPVRRWGSTGRSPASCARWRPSSRSPSSGTTSGSSSTRRTRCGASSAGRSGGSRSRGSGASRSTTTSASRVSIGLAASRPGRPGDAEPLRRHLWMLAGLAVLVALTVLAAPLYHRWYRHMRRPGADDRGAVRTYPPPAPERGLGRRRRPSSTLDDEGRTT